MTQDEFDAAFNRGLVRYVDDCVVIAIIGKQHGITMTLQQAEKIWDDYSESMCAGWMTLPELEDGYPNEDAIWWKIKAFVYE